jgi:hypothetical protein
LLREGEGGKEGQEGKKRQRRKREQGPDSGKCGEPAVATRARTAPTQRTRHGALCNQLEGAVRRRKVARQAGRLGRKGVIVGG